MTDKQIAEELEELKAENKKLREDLKNLKEILSDVLMDNEKLCESLEESRRIGALLFKWCREMEEEEAEK